MDRKIVITISLILIIMAGILLTRSSFLSSDNTAVNRVSTRIKWWEITSVDTMKYSRDLAREKASDRIYWQQAERQVRLIKGLGATHVAVGTPYDEEFIPVMSGWVELAKKYELNVWFRGNFSGWEEWFEYPAISANEHTEKLDLFIRTNPGLFRDGDIFTSCTECENGGTGDPRETGDVEGFRQFLSEQYRVGDLAFKDIGKDVAANYYSMNADVAKLVMDHDTTQKLDGVVVIDHYVAETDQLIDDIDEIAKFSGGKIVLGELGVPIPDIHGDMTQEMQQEWLEKLLYGLARNENLVGINYWLAVGGSTQIWEENGHPRLAVATLKKYFQPEIFQGKVVDDLGKPVADAVVTLGGKRVATNGKGDFALPYLADDKEVAIEAEGYTPEVESINKGHVFEIERTDKDLIYNLRKILYQLSKI